MKFCDYCENMMYISVNAEKNLLYYCKNCDNKIEVSKDQGSVCVIDDNKIDDITKYNQYLNKNIKYDPTLPRVNNIKCINSECNKKGDQENEVIYIKYDFINMKYLYFCCHCEHFWKAT